jgi:hypothetical protein
MSDGPSGISPPRPGEGTLVARGATLEGFVAATNAGVGVALRALEPLTSLIIETRNTCYHVIVTRGDEVIIEGGTFFPVPTQAHLDGASLGSSLLRLGWVGIGLRMEIRVGGQRIVTTPVQAIRPGETESAARPH